MEKFMPREENMPTTETEPTRYHSGTVAIQEGEIGRLRAEAAGSFAEHPVLQNVEMRELDMSALPEAVHGLIEERGGQPTTFAVIRTRQGIPTHTHFKDGEIYFMGTGGTVSLYDDNGQLIEEVPFNEGVFTATHQGEAHSVAVDPNAETVFFAVKFTAKN